MAALEKIEFAKLGPCRFVGKSVYCQPFSAEPIGALWAGSEAVFEAIDRLNEYATDEVHNAALITGNGQDNLMRYTIGRFMKTDTPVPEGLDSVDLSETFVAKGWIKGEFNDMVQSADSLTATAAKQQDKYSLTWTFMAEIYTDETIPEDGVSSVLGYYIACKENE